MRRMKIFWTFTLLMIHVGALSSISVRGDSGGEVNIPCRYNRKYTANTKYFCKGKWITCSKLIKTDEKNKWVDSGRFSLFDDTTAAVFTVTFRNLSERDSGTYQCAVDISRGKDSYTEVNLIVESGSSLIIGVSVTLLLLIIGLVSFIVALRKKHQARDKDPESDSKRSAPGTENSEEVPEMLYIYEEIKDTRPQTDYKTAPLPTNPSDSTKTVYATTQLPTNPSDSTKTICATPQLPTNPSDSTKMVYATTQLPTNPPDSTKTVYATTQLPTNPSDSTKTVNATPQLPTNPSDSTKMVNATPKFPTNPSDSTKTIYATPQLPTNPSDSTKTVKATPQLPTNPSDSNKMVNATPQLPTNPSDSTNAVYARV